jgi:hypothetical protein
MADNEGASSKVNIPQLDEKNYLMHVHHMIQKEVILCLRLVVDNPICWILKTVGLHTPSPAIRPQRCLTNPIDSTLVTRKTQNRKLTLNSLLCLRSGCKGPGRPGGYPRPNGLWGGFGHLLNKKRPGPLLTRRVSGAGVDNPVSTWADPAIWPWGGDPGDRGDS